MKKNVIRLTEAELKQYISKVVAEQTTNPTADQEATRQKMNALQTAVGGKNVQLYLDAAKTKKAHLVKIVTVGYSKTTQGRYFFGVKDLSYVTPSGADTDPQDGMGPITNIRFDCTEPDELFIMGQGGKNLGVVYCPPLNELIKKTVACKTVNLKPDLATAKPVAPVEAPPKADIA